VGGDAHRVLLFWHRIGNGLLTLLSNMFTDLNLSDMETGYKAFRADILKAITIEKTRFGLNRKSQPRSPSYQMSGSKRSEVGVSYHGRTYAEGKKVGWKDGLYALYCVVKYNIFR
jgi:hypothetical protein